MIRIYIEGKRRAQYLLHLCLYFDRRSTLQLLTSGLLVVLLLNYFLDRARLLLDLVIYKHNSADIVADIAQYKAELKARDELKRK
ncbi:unnamed protein product [Camellia sinensis]